MNISIKALSGKMEYALNELKKFLSEYTNANIFVSDENGDATIELFVDSSMEEHWYSLVGDGKKLKISGGNESSVLCGVYEALKDAGIFFEATGYSLPDKFDFEKMMNLKKDVRPKVRLRGIRQHINFPMDISAYTLEEAKEYIRSIARMRFNAITFHSYERQWHVSQLDEPEVRAGQYFYGQYHPVPKDPNLAKLINNRKTFCIPEVEPIFDDVDARQEYSYYWLGEVMNTAKEAGMKVTLSVEPAHLDEKIRYEMLNRVCRRYSQIDVFEIISYECGGGLREFVNPELTIENIGEKFKAMFGEEFVNADGTVNGVNGEVGRQLNAVSVNLERIIKMIKDKDIWLKGLDKVPELRAGLYVSDPDAIRVLKPIMTKLIPEDVTLSILSAHAAHLVARNIEECGYDDSDWQRTMIYSWAEFDGSMYAQQLSTNGIEKLTAMPKADSVYGICYNHWRTAENNLTISFAAETSITPLKADTYYREYADILGITDEDNFAKASARLAKLDEFLRDDLINIGFCYVNLWFKKNKVARPLPLEEKALIYAIEEYDGLVLDYEKLLLSAVSHKAIAYLRLMINRCKTSALLARTVYAIKRIDRYYDYDNPQELNLEQKGQIFALIEEARQYAKEYAYVYGEILPDRGGEGLIASYCETVPPYVEAVASTFDKDIEVYIAEAGDAPPPPDGSV